MTVVLAVMATGCAGLVPRQGYARAERQPDGSWARSSAPPYSTGDRIAIAANFGCTLADMISTEVALANGMREGNPLLGNRGVRIPLMLGTSALIWAIGEYKGWRKFANGTKAAFGCTAAAWNFSMANRRGD